MKLSKPLLLSSWFCPFFILLLFSLIITPNLILVPHNSKETIINMENSTENNDQIIIDLLGVKIERNPPQSRLDELQVKTWPKWSGEPSKIPWTFETGETMYLLEGKVWVTVDKQGSFEIGGGDLVVFPKGMKITWEVVVATTKHYHLDE